MTKTASSRYSRSGLRPGGFTLVEMLVTVTLVLIMMSMFAQVFVWTTDSLSKQRGIAENDQRGRLLSMTIRGDLDGRTFRDVLPFRANEDTRNLGHSLARRSGYLEIDEGNPSDDTDDVLQFTASVNIRLQGNDNSPYVGNALPLSAVVASYGTNSFTLSDGGAYASAIPINSRIWALGYPTSANVPYTVSGVSVSGGNTTIAVYPGQGAPPGTLVCLTENDPDFDDGLFGNSTSISSLAEVCYFLRNGVLYRRVLLIRDTPTGVNAQPSLGNGVPLLWNGTNGNYAPTGSTFWRDFDYSAFYYNGNNSGLAPGVRFHNAAESLSNSSQSPQFFMNGSSYPFSLGIPHLRFGHSTTNGLPQDASTTATYNGSAVSIGRFNLQECSNTSFGYPGNLINGNPFDSQNIVIDPPSGLVNSINGQAYLTTQPNGQMTGQTARRGQDVLMSNVLSFDVKVWQPIGWNPNYFGAGMGGWDTSMGQFVDVGNSVTLGPFNSTAGVITDLDGNIVGGRLNSTYGINTGTVTNPNNHYRFDTWHPNASVNTSTFPSSILYSGYPATPTFYNEPPYYNNPPASGPYTYNEPPYVPVTVHPVPGPFNAITQPFNPAIQSFQTAPLTAIQITINYRDISSNQVRQVTIVQSLVDQVKRTSVTNESAEE